MYHEGHVANAEENYPMAKVISRMEAFCSKKINNRSNHPLELIASNAHMKWNCKQMAVLGHFPS